MLTDSCSVVIIVSLIFVVDYTNSGYQQSAYSMYPQASQQPPSYSVPSSASASTAYTNIAQVSAPSATYSYSTGQVATAYAAPPNPPVPTYSAYQTSAAVVAPPPPPVAVSDGAQSGIRPPPPPPPPNQQNVSEVRDFDSSLAFYHEELMPNTEIFK